MTTEQRGHEVFACSVQSSAGEEDPDHSLPRHRLPVAYRIAASYNCGAGGRTLGPAVLRPSNETAPRKLQYLWRAVDQDGEVLDILVQLRRNWAAKKLFRKLLKGLRSTFHAPSSPTSSVVMPRPRRRYCPTSSTSKISDQTIELDAFNLYLSARTSGKRRTSAM